MHGDAAQETIYSNIQWKWPSFGNPKERNGCIVIDLDGAFEGNQKIMGPFSK